MGGGVELYMLPNLCLSGTALYRLMRYSDVKGLGDWMEIAGGLNGNGICLMIGVALNFYVSQTAPALQKLDPVMLKLQGTIMGGLHGTSVPKLIEDEKKDRADLAKLFHWPENP